MLLLMLRSIGHELATIKGFALVFLKSIIQKAFWNMLALWRLGRLGVVAC